MNGNQDAAAVLQKETYLLGRHFKESARLHLQHWLWKSQTGWNIHPSINIPSTLGEGETYRIADQGAGNCAWILEVADELPSGIKPHTKLYGFDVSLANFPAADNCSPEVHFAQLNAFDDVPENLTGIFDIVHIRVFSAVVRNNDSSPLIKNAARMLKPGGWLQWDEFNSASFKAISPNAGVSSKWAQKMTEVMMKNANVLTFNPSWIANLDQQFKENGFENVQFDKTTWAPKLRKPITDDMLMMTESVVVLTKRDGKLIGTEENFDEIWAHALEEISKGVSLTMDPVVCVGQKPACG
ncbi:hypothetical protein M501DRAFT_995036 [Patellaria atrata CBS 101060]|uniref:Methyltransferase domain-containing protein n=1 Tax=Patellaria atrata CBS 101060 TaxID=1346257 RepID=A0A9P4S9R7_9PEZI|nr:hypothetical protein M501DRAFT_995036 [Patellaria atrata CBS 101060]